jgi:amino acid transporter
VEADDPSPTTEHAAAAEPRVPHPPRPPAGPPLDVEPTEVVHGGRPGTRYARRTRVSQRRFHPSADAGIYTATPRATAPRGRAGRWWTAVRRVTVGSPISSEHQEEQRLSKTKALAVFSSDALSSSAYATDEILLYLSVAGVASLTYSIEVGLAIALLLAIVVFSYRQTIKAYPNGGGAYIVARENLGNTAGFTAAAALSVDYVLTVSVSIAAGVLAITSAFPELDSMRTELALGCIALITLANLRGIRESGTIFAIPTYGFVVAMLLLLVAGFARLALDPSLKAEIPASVHEPGTQALTWFIVLRAFASGCAALTGVEAISNGIPAFKKPESHNASVTLVWMGVILTTLFLGITVLAHQLGVQHSPEVSAPAQIAKTVFGDNPLFYGIQAFTALILILAANTAYADFPRLASILARDRFVPHQFTFRGDRLAFSNGILLLGVAASAVLVVFDANLNRLIPLYAFGVFVSFTLSQGGMIVHWLRGRESGWRLSMAINAVGATATAVVAAIIGMTKFVDGAWLSMSAMAVLAMFFLFIHLHYSRVDRRLAVPEGISVAPPLRNHRVVVLVDSVNRAAARTLQYALSVSQNVTALHVSEDAASSVRAHKEWGESVLDVPMVVIRSPYRSFVAPVLSYLDAIHDSEPDTFVTVVLPEIRTAWPWQRWLHNQTSGRLRDALMDRPATAVVRVPYDLAG